MKEDKIVDKCGEEGYISSRRGGRIVESALDDEINRKLVQHTK